MSIWLTGFFASFTALFAIVEPFSLIPVYLGLTDRLSPKERKLVCLKAVAIALAILLAFALSGEGIFRLFGISIPAFRIAGGILLLLLGISQLNATQERVKSDEESESYERDDISIFPLATPLLAGPGAISAVVLQAGRSHSVFDTALFLFAIVLVLVAAYGILRSAPFLYRVLGKTGLNLLGRLMGIILTAIAVQYIIDGAVAVWQSMQKGV